MRNGRVVLSGGTPARFRTQFESNGYGCKDATGSLLPVPPGETRRGMGYCGRCEAVTCLLTGVPVEHARRGLLRLADVPRDRPPPRDWSEMGDLERRKRTEQARRRTGRLRARGLDYKGQPLKESCWNCTAIRVCKTGYLCRYLLDEAPVPAQRMQHRRPAKMGCTRFDLRLVMEIPTVAA